MYSIIGLLVGGEKLEESSAPGLVEWETVTGAISVRVGRKE